jgi:hypothetical protein
VFAAGIAVFAVGMPLLILSIHLDIVVREDELSIRFFPLRRRHYQKNEIISHSVVAYRPLRDFGGWGIRYGRMGKAYTVSGDGGARLVLVDGRAVIIGTRRAEELNAALDMMA